MVKRTALTLLIILNTLAIGRSCSAIVLKDKSRVLLAKNFDWTYGEGMLIKNLRGTAKAAYFTHEGRQASWISRYGSVTFNQNGREMPYGGMNEKGLAVEMLWLELTRYNTDEPRQYVNELEWIQYQLDNFETVRQVISHLDQLKIYPIKGKIHYILTDTTGESVIIEYLNGQPIAYTKEPNVCQAITNNAVFQSEPFKNQVKGIRKNNTAPTYRYYKLEQEIAALPGHGEISTTYAFDILKKVAIPRGGFRTMWSIVYDVAGRNISFFTDTHRKVKTIHLSDLDFNEGLAYFPLNQDKQTNLGNGLLETLSEPLNYGCLSPSLIHLGFDEELAKEMSRRQFEPGQGGRTSIFAERYFHLEITAPLEEERQTGFLAVMDSEQGFRDKEAVRGGYLYGSAGKGDLVFPVYGLKNGKYALLAFIDTNKNHKPDLGKKGKPGEKYATFADRTFADEREISFANTSADLSRSNARVLINWKQ